MVNLLPPNIHPSILNLSSINQSIYIDPSINLTYLSLSQGFWLYWKLFHTFSGPWWVLLLHGQSPTPKHPSIYSQSIVNQSIYLYRSINQSYLSVSKPGILVVLKALSYCWEHRGTAFWTMIGFTTSWLISLPHSSIPPFIHPSINQPISPICL